VTRITLAAALLAALITGPAYADETIGSPCTNERVSPSLISAVSVCLAPGTTVTPTGVTAWADGLSWVALADGGWVAGGYIAGAPNSVIETTKTLGGGETTCILAIENRETGGTYQSNLTNPYSGAYGPLQYLPSGGVWSATPDGRAGIPVTQAGVGEQVKMARWAIENGYGSAWAPLPASC
jgi:hypothetical protein